eukprot:5907091-Amphidinium_carterae.1
MISSGHHPCETVEGELICCAICKAFTDLGQKLSAPDPLVAGRGTAKAKCHIVPGCSLPGGRYRLGLARVGLKV